MHDIIRYSILVLYSSIGMYFASVNVQVDNISRKRKISIFLFIFLVIFFLGNLLGQITTFFCMIGITFC